MHALLYDCFVRETVDGEYSGVCSFAVVSYFEAMCLICFGVFLAGYLKKQAALQSKKDGSDQPTTYQHCGSARNIYDQSSVAFVMCINAYAVYKSMRDARVYYAVIYGVLTIGAGWAFFGYFLGVRKLYSDRKCTQLLPFVHQVLGLFYDGACEVTGAYAFFIALAWPQ